MDDELPDFDRFGRDEARLLGSRLGGLSLSGLEPTGDHEPVVAALQEAAAR